MSEKQQLLAQSENKIIEYDNIKYLINEEENTAGVIGIEGKQKQIFIPRSIKQGTNEYNITSIMENAFKSSRIKTIQFSSDSKLERIEKNAFYSTKIKSITIPSSVISIGEGAFFCCFELQDIKIPNDSKLKTIDKNAFCALEIKSIRIPSELIDLKEGCYSYISNTTEIIVSPNNPRYCLYEDKLLLGKTRIEENTYENLIFCIRNIKHIKIPNFIKHICSFSFQYCCQLETIEISNESKLETIDTCAFSNSAIKNIRIPSELIDLKERWCDYTPNLTEIIVSPNNPRYCLYEENVILGKTRIEENNYENLIFCCRNIKHIKIPNFIKHICSYSFEYSYQLKTIEIPNDSKLETIDACAFSHSTIKSIRIPSSVTSIEESAFFDCKQLGTIEISSESKLKTIDKDAFSCSAIKSIIIPSSVILIEEGAFAGCYQLETIQIPNDSKLQTIDKNAFSKSKIKSIIIPSSVTLIGEDAFSLCEQLQIIEINNKEMISMCQSHFKDCINAILMIPVDF